MNEAEELGQTLGWGQSQYHSALMEIIAKERSALKAGEIALNKNHRVKPGDVGSAAAVGVK